jgi:hypothetical protein
MRQGASSRSFVNIHATHRHSHRGAATCDNAARCDIASAAAGATDRLATIDAFAELADAPRPIKCKRGAAMRLLLVFLASLLVGQSISVGIGLLVERHATPYTGLVTFIVCYFAMFWMAWRFAVRVTEPRSRARDRGEPSAVLLGYAAADDLWSQSALLL